MRVLFVMSEVVAAATVAAASTAAQLKHCLAVELLFEALLSQSTAAVVLLQPVQPV
jgi:hypothetical protein